MGENTQIDHILVDKREHLNIVLSDLLEALTDHYLVRLSVSK
jgi:hypothetical protein